MLRVWNEVACVPQWAQKVCAKYCAPESISRRMEFLILSAPEREIHRLIFCYRAERVADKPILARPAFKSAERPPP
jgi:hypothetical protein